MGLDTETFGFDGFRGDGVWFGLVVVPYRISMPKCVGEEKLDEVVWNLIVVTYPA